MNRFKLGVFLGIVLFSGHAQAVPIEVSVSTNEVYFPSGASNLELIFSYDSSSTPTCTGTSDAGRPSNPATYNQYQCQISDFITGVTVNLNGASISLSDISSTYTWWALFEGSDQAFGIFPDGLFQFDESGFDAWLLIESVWAELLIELSGETRYSLLQGDIFGTDFLALLYDRSMFQFDSAIINGETVHRVPEPGTLILLSTGLAALGFSRRRRRRPQVG